MLANPRQASCGFGMMFSDQGKKNYVWLDPQVMQWFSYSQGGADLDVNLRSRAYEIWNHAEQLLKHATSDLQLVDVITTLKRSIDQRMRALDETYTFEAIPMKDKPSDLLGFLEALDIVRPLMFRNLLKIRNAVEHEDAPPPDLKSTQIFLEFAWYFLRSTDRMLQTLPYEVGFYPTDEDDHSYWVELGYGPQSDWNPTLRGWIRPHLISTQPIADWVVLVPVKLETWAELRGRLHGEGDEEMLKRHSERRQRQDDLYFQGGVRGPQGAIVSLTKIYFSAG